MHLSGHNQGPSPIMIGVIAALLLILLLSLKTCNPESTSTLRSSFAAAEATTVAGQQDGLPLPEPVREWGSTAIAQLRGGDAVVPITPVAANDILSVDIKSLQQVTSGLQIKGEIKNTGKQNLRVPLAAFRFIDQTGTVYAAQGNAAANLPPNGTTTLDLTLPIQEPTTLTMLVEIPESNVHLEMKLLTSDE